MSARRIVSIAALVAALNTFTAAAQDSLSPAELPPADFAGREYVDSRGCVFLRSTFGGQVTWVPRFGPDRQPICNGQTTTEVAAPADPAAPATTTATAPAPAPVVRPVPQPVGQVRLPPAPTLGKEPPRRTARATAPRKPSAPRQTRYRGPDADGRHPDCPSNAQFGRLVRMETGKIMVMCVISPDLFPEAKGAAPAMAMDKAADAPAAKPVQMAAADPAAKGGDAAPAPAMAHGRVLQVGSFGVPANAHRVQARLQAQGIPVHLHRAGRLTVVTAGPFADGVQAHAAMGAVRGMGIRDAFFR